MEELMKSLQGHKNKQSTEETLSKQVNGVLTIHVKWLQLADSDMDSSVVSLLYLSVEVCRMVKKFTLSGVIEDGKVTCDRVKHYTVELPEKSDDPKNVIKFDLLVSSLLLPGRSSLLGQATLHLHDIIQGSPMTGRCELKDEHGGMFAIMAATLIFAYGTFGYGESLQIEPTPGHKLDDHLYCSAFPRLTPQDHRVDQNRLTLVPRPTKHPTFIPFDSHAQLCAQETAAESSGFGIEPPVRLMDKMTRLSRVHCQYKSIKDRCDRLRFLEDLVLSEQDTMDSVDEPESAI